MFNPEDYAGAGTDNLSDSAGMPLISIIQSGSAQYKKSHKDYATKGIDGCQEGDILLNAENRILKAPIKVIPIRLQKTYTQWSDDNKLVAIHPETIVTDPKHSSKQDGKKTRHYLDSEEIVYTEYWFVKFLEQGAKEYQNVVIALKSTQLGLSTLFSNARKDAKRSDQYTKIDCDAPIFSFEAELSTEPRSNDFGSWFVWSMGQAKILDFTKDKATLDACAESYDEVKLLELSGDAPKQVTEDKPY